MTRLAFLLGLALLLAAGCGGSAGYELSRPQPEQIGGAGLTPASPAPEPAGSAAGPRFAAQPVCAPGEEKALGNPRLAYAAVARGRTPALSRPGGAVVRVFEPVTVNGVPTVFAVLGAVVDVRCEVRWYRVHLPVRPNGAVGYVEADAIDLHRVRTRIEVDLSERRLDFFRDGRRLLRVTAGIGSATTPTPTGRFYVNQRLLALNPAGPYGPGGLGISAFSPVLVDWPQGGPIAIHGTNDPDSIGKAVSNGCVRVPNETLLWLFRATPTGTPVVIHP